jgi:hypothetical protein
MLRHPSQGVNDDETEILSVPVRLRRAGQEIRMVIDGTDPFAAAKPDTRLIRLLGVVRLTSSRSEKPESRMDDHTAATAFRHSLAAAARKIRSVDRETRWR